MAIAKISKLVYGFWTVQNGNMYFENICNTKQFKMNFNKTHSHLLFDSYVFTLLQKVTSTFWITEEIQAMGFNVFYHLIFSLDLQIKDFFSHEKNSSFLCTYINSPEIITH